eukprot:GHVH01014445.1.p1 GENE.GHVH01014445.1~~GHVH01014445.1.p1  ORF type:complete len:653 (+),score=101.58 GHVH01014445.1:330-2288(+)
MIDLCFLSQVTSPISIPSTRVAIMDGYAFHPSTPLNPLVEVNTGMPVDTEALRVIPIEEMDDFMKREGILIEDIFKMVPDLLFNSLPSPGGTCSNIREIGSDVRGGDPICGPGTPLNAGELAVMSACGVTRIPVLAPLRVRVVVTGDELSTSPMSSLEPDLKLQGSVNDANGPLIVRQLVEMNRRGLLPNIDIEFYQSDDDSDKMVKLLEWDGLNKPPDLILTAGGVSAGSREPVIDAVEQLVDSGKAEILIRGASVKPGKPLLVSRLFGPSVSNADAPNHSIIHFGLPGNPQSVLTMLHLVVYPFMRRIFCPQPEERLEMNSRYTPRRFSLEAPKESLPENLSGREEYLRCGWNNGKTRAELRSSQRSSDIFSLLSRNSELLLKNQISHDGRVEAMQLFELPDWSNASAPRGMMSSTDGIDDSATSEKTSCACYNTTNHDTIGASSSTPLYGAAVVICSDRLSSQSDPNYLDKSTWIIEEQLSSLNIVMNERRVVADDEDAICSVLEDMLKREDVNIIIFSGGTGATVRDVTPDVVVPLLTKRFPGIELAIYMDGLKETKKAALSRLLVGSISRREKSTLVCCLPGSPSGAGCAMKSLNQYVHPLLNQMNQTRKNTWNKSLELFFSSYFSWQLFIYFLAILVLFFPNASPL